MVYKYRGQGGYNRQMSANNDQKYDYASSGGIFQKKGRAAPAASQFGNVWELNFSPMSRMAYSSSKPKMATNHSNKKKKIKYKSGHVRRETRLKKAFEQMKNIDVGDLENEEINDKEKKNNKKRTSKKSNKSLKNVNNVGNNNNNNNRSGTPSKSKGTEMYSKYKRTRTFSKPSKPGNIQEF